MRKKLVALTAIMTLILAISATAERTGSKYVAPFGFGVSSAGTGVCAAATVPLQCAVFDLDSDPLPPFVIDTLIAEGVVSGDCGDIVVLTSGDPLDPDSEISTAMPPFEDEPRDNSIDPGCGPNPDGKDTYDCVDLPFTPPSDHIVLAVSSEYAEFLFTAFTDWMRIGGVLDISINDWSDVSIIPYGPDDSGTVTLATIGQDIPVDLRIADSGDEIYDTAFVIVPLACFQEEPETELCGNGQIDPGEECDGGTDVTCQDLGHDFGTVSCSPNTCLLVPECGDDEPPVDPFCGDDVVNQPGEECDGTDDSQCPGECSLQCECPVPPPPPEDEIPEFSAIGAGIALLGAGLLVAKRRKK